MTRTLAISAIVAALAAPAFAQSAQETAFAVFNASADSVTDIRSLPAGDSAVTVSTRGDDALAVAYAVLNESADSVSDLRGLNGATVYDNTPAYAADKFAELRAAD
jgi:hypothetical protein